jgi:4-hydroxy-tetrahydrodipicolinate synthase
MTTKLEGVIVPLLTPFTPGGEQVDEPALRKLVDRMVEAKVNAVIANGATGEYFHLAEKERERVAEIVVDQAAGRVPVMVGATAFSTHQTIRWAKHAEQLGAMGLLLMTPYYIPAAVDTTIQHFARVSDAVSLPIMLYNNEIVTGLLMSPAQIGQLAEKANVPWVKLTTGQVEHVAQILALLGDKVQVFEGWDTVAFASLASGSSGWVSGPANAIPELALELVKLVRQDADLTKAYAHFRKILPLLDYAGSSGFFASFLKEVCGLRGYPLGAVRAPYRELSDAGKAKARELATSLGLIG